MADDDKQTAPAVPPKPVGPSFAEQLIAVGERLGSAIRTTLREIAARRGMPLTVAGVIVLILAWLSERDSAWGFPMLLAGMALIGLGLIGPRLSGSMALRWGEDGAHFQLSSTVAPPGQQRKAPALPAPAEEAVAETPLPGARAAADPALIPPTEIEGQAETIEFSVEHLRQT